MRRTLIAPTMTPTLHAFWSYSRATEETGGAELHRAMQQALADPISLHGELRIFRDNHVESGIRAGADWGRSLVEALARASLFFWVQSPRWLRHGSMCQFEFEAFEDRIARIAREFLRPSSTTTPDELMEALMVPVRLFEMAEADWSHIEATVRGRFEREWSRRQVLPALHLPALRARAAFAGDNYGTACMAAAAPIATRFAGVLSALNIDLRTLGAFLEADRAGFERHWMKELQRRLQLPSPPRQQVAHEPQLALQGQLALRVNGGRVRAPHSPLGIGLVLIPDKTGAHGFWAGATPVGNAALPALASVVDDPSQLGRGPGGFLMCTAAGARALQEPLAGVGLYLPDTDQSDSLRAIFALGRDAAGRLGFKSVPGDFWSQRAGGAVVPGADAALRKMLLLVNTLE